MKYKVVQIGWDNENTSVPIILLCAKDRKKEKIEEKSIVRVKHGKTKSLALVDMQFRGHTGFDNVTTINTVLKKNLGCDINDKIEIDKFVLESEYNEFMKNVIKQGLETISHPPQKEIGGMVLIRGPTFRW